MRIITRPDFDGIVCAVLLTEALKITEPVLWVEPNVMQKGLVAVRPDDIIANLPFHETCYLWFDHHYTNRIDRPFNGVFQIAPSAARIVFEYYRSALNGNYESLVNAADKIDSAALTLDEVLHPEKNAYMLLSMTVDGLRKKDDSYWNRLVELLRKYHIDRACKDREVQERFHQVLRQNREYKSLLEKHTFPRGIVTLTDFRGLDPPPAGNRFLIYSLFPGSAVNVKIHTDVWDDGKVVVRVGRSIFSNLCRVNVGLMLAGFGGGGHRGAGGARFHPDTAEEKISEIIRILLENKNNEP